MIVAIDGKLELGSVAPADMIEEVDSAAVQALCGLGTVGAKGVPAIRGLVNRHQKECPGRSEKFLSELPKLGDEGIALLIEILALPNPVLQKESAELLGKLGAKAKNARPGLEKLFASPSPWVRYTAACALWNIEQNMAAIPVLTKLLNERDVEDPNWKGGDPKLAAAHRLEEIGAPAKQSVPELIKAHNQRSSRTESGFFDAIKAIDPDEAKKLKKPE